jgi:hypothetical protein
MIQWRRKPSAFALCHEEGKIVGSPPPDRLATTLREVHAFLTGTSRRESFEILELVRKALR